ncbi:MAG: hypothetical protein V1701_02335 [Planctomycetota bacterium]
MSKAIQAINTMISNQDKISDVRKVNNSYIFLYNQKYVWEIWYYEEGDVYSVSFYPEIKKVIDVVNVIDNLTGINFITYNSKDFGTKEAYETFIELYRVVKEKLFGIDKVLDDIIGDDEEVPF